MQVKAVPLQVKAEAPALFAAAIPLKATTMQRAEVGREEKSVVTAASSDIRPEKTCDDAALGDNDAPFWCIVSGRRQDDCRKK